jgi:hypothetical protein
VQGSKQKWKMRQEHNRLHIIQVLQVLKGLEQNSEDRRTNSPRTQTIGERAMSMQ